MAVLVEILGYGTLKVSGTSMAYIRIDGAEGCVTRSSEGEIEMDLAESKALRKALKRAEKAVSQ